MGIFVEMYDKLGEDGSEVFFIYMISGMSGIVVIVNSVVLMIDIKVIVVDF